MNTNNIINVHPLLGQKPHVNYNHKYKGFGIHDSECNVKMWKTDDNKWLVVCTDLGKGTSVTNASEQLATEIYNEHFKGVDKSNILFTETYQDYKVESLDMWILEWEGDKAVGVDYKPLAQIIRE